jgi:hypothetical protein
VAAYTKSISNLQKQEFAEIMVYTIHRYKAEFTQMLSLGNKSRHSLTVKLIFFEAQYTQCCGTCCQHSVQSFFGKSFDVPYIDID